MYIIDTPQGDNPVTRIEFHGVHNHQHFQGAGVAFTGFSACWTGCGGSPADALEDALEQGYAGANAEEEAALSLVPEWDDIDDLFRRDLDAEEVPDEAYHYVTVYVRDLPAGGADYDV